MSPLNPILTLGLYQKYEFMLWFMSPFNPIPPKNVHVYSCCHFNPSYSQKCNCDCNCWIKQTLHKRANKTNMFYVTQTLNDIPTYSWSFVLHTEKVWLIRNCWPIKSWFSFFFMIVLLSYLIISKFLLTWKHYVRPKKKVFDWRNPTDPRYPADPRYLY